MVYHSYQPSIGGLISQHLNTWPTRPSQILVISIIVRFVFVGVGKGTNRPIEHSDTNFANNVSYCGCSFVEVHYVNLWKANELDTTQEAILVKKSYIVVVDIIIGNWGNNIWAKLR